MKPGDLVRFTHHTGIPFTPETLVGLYLGSRTTKWDRNIPFRRFLTPDGVREVLIGPEFKGTSWEVLVEFHSQEERCQSIG